jgi:hypothetical protein
MRAFSRREIVGVSVALTVVGVLLLVIFGTGVLAIYAVVIAAATLAVTLWLGQKQLSAAEQQGFDAGTTAAAASRQADLAAAEQQRRAREDEALERHFYRLLFETTYEAAHNLQHIAQVTAPAGRVDKAADRLEYRRAAAEDSPSIRPERPFDAWPEFETIHARRLFDARFAAFFPSGNLWPYIDHMIRNDHYVRRYPFDPEGLARAQPIVAYFAEYCIRVLIEGARHSDWRGTELVRLLREQSVDIQEDIVSRDAPKFFVRYQATWAIDALENGREDAQDAKHVFCWLDDVGATWDEHAETAIRQCLAGKRQATTQQESVEPPKLHPLWGAFKELHDPPPRPRFDDR